MLRAIIYNKLDGSADEALGVVSLDKNKKVIFCRDMDADLKAYLESGIRGNREIPRIFPSMGKEYIEAIPDALAGTNLYAILKD
jgi:hypothetical protein